MKPRKQGLTLMEILIALFIFSFAALYVSRTVSRLLKRQKKVEKEVKDSRGHSNILEILRQDLKGIRIHFDMNLHLNQWAHSALSEIEGEGGKIPFEGRNFMNPQFDFFGEENQLTFTTHIPIAGDRESEQLVKISYFLKQCANRETGKTASCLIRGVSHHWKDRKDLENQKNRVLIRGLKDITFSYYHPEKKEWERTWDFLSLWKQGEARSKQRMILLPLSIQINMEREKKSSAYIFSVSHPFLHTFRPETLSPLVYLSISKPSLAPSPDKNKDKDDPDPTPEESLHPTRTAPTTGFGTSQPSFPRSGQFPSPP